MKELKIIAVIDKKDIECIFDNDISECMFYDFFECDYCVVCISLDDKIMFCEDNIHGSPLTFAKSVECSLQLQGENYRIQKGYTIAQDKYNPTEIEINNAVWDTLKGMNKNES